MNSPPEYFQAIAEKSNGRWDQLEADPELAGPWRQLFSQVQSPRHVVSEMLQNADDAGATWVEVSIRDGRFIFEHNGRDFSESEFASLCRFGYSNKRSLHTIGFRGIGFKSLFSLGGTVGLSTPTLNIQFNADRFTEPTWVQAPMPSDRTRIEVAISDENRKTELLKNFDQWCDSPLSLLFFSSVEKLSIQGHVIEKKVISDGPTMNSKWIQLVGSSYDRLLHIRSECAEFPGEAIEEIKQERNTEELNLPPCRVEIVCGEKLDSRLFVVLPTGVAPALPFSCHGPFLQDPARYGIKDPATSPTNRWLLDRVGHLAADTMFEWLDNRGLSEEERAKAYMLLPSPSPTGDDLNTSVTDRVNSKFQDECHKTPNLLTDDGELAFAPKCVAIPPGINGVWSNQQIDQILGLDGNPRLSPLVGKNARHKLEAFHWIKILEAKDVIHALRQPTSIPRPSSLRAIASLWKFIRQTKLYAYTDRWKKEVRIVPVQGSEELFTPPDVVRLSERKSDLPESEWQFLSTFIRIVDGEWLSALKEADVEDSSEAKQTTALADAAALLKEIGLSTPTSTDQIVSHVCQGKEFRRNCDREGIIRLTHIFAAFGATVPANFPYFNRQGDRRSVSDGLMWETGSGLEDVLPDAFCDARIIHEDYDAESAACNKNQWRIWVTSSKSRLSALCILNWYVSSFTRGELEKFLDSMGASPPIAYQYKKGFFSIDDREVEPSVVQYISQQEHVFPDNWATLLSSLLACPIEQLKRHLHATIKEEASNGNSRNALVEPMPATWIRQFAAKPCLRDSHNVPRIPADLLLRTPDTEPLLGIDSFVSADLDTPDNRPLLKLLGARDTASGTDQIVNRIRALSNCDAPPIHELAKWYEALDLAAARAAPNEIAELRNQFSSQAMIWTNDKQWSTSSEVFCFADTEVMPEAATIHASVEGLPLWKRLGVADRPTRELVIEWLSQLKIGEKLDSTIARRVQACLKAFPDEIYTQLNAWLSLDQHWQSVDTFRYKYRSGSELRLTELFVAAKRNTADLRGQRAGQLASSSFSHAMELQSAVEFVLSDTALAGNSREAPDWLDELGDALQRIVMDDQNAQDRIRSLGLRMRHSKWQPVTSIQVMPYLDNAPVGQPLRPSVLWRETTLYVRDVSLVGIIDDLINELHRPFELPAIAEAIRMCVDRSRGFISEYLAGKFDLESPQVICSAPNDGNEEIPHAGSEASYFADGAPPTGHALADGNATVAENHDSPSWEDSPVEVPPESEFPDSPDDSHTPYGEPKQEIDESGEGQPQSSEINGSHEEAKDSPAEDSFNGVSDRDEPTPEKEKPSDPPKPSLLDRYLAQCEFRKCVTENGFVASDGSRMRRTSGMFTLELYDVEGRLSKQIWHSAQTLTGGLEIPAEVWHMIQNAPQTTAIVCESPQGQPIELSGTFIRRMLGEDRLQLFPAKYRLKQTAELATLFTAHPELEINPS